MSMEEFYKDQYQRQRILIDNLVLMNAINKQVAKAFADGEQPPQKWVKGSLSMTDFVWEHRHDKAWDYEELRQIIFNI